MDDIKFKVTVQYGYLELRQVTETRGNVTWFGGYAVSRDLDGNEISRTPVDWYGYATYE